MKSVGWIGDQGSAGKEILTRLGRGNYWRGLTKRGEKKRKKSERPTDMLYGG